MVAALLATPLIAGSAAAQDKPAEMKFAHWVPAQHPLSKLGYEVWAKSVEEASKGSIKVLTFPAQQLGKAPDHYDMARDGIADLTWVNPGYQAGRFPLFAVGEIPFLISDPGGGSAALDAWYRKHVAKEMGDVHFCFAHLHIGAIHSKKPITSPTELKGMKFRPSQGTVAAFVSSLGGTNVQVSAPEARDAMEKGVADAMVFPWKSILTFGIDKVVKYHTDLRLYAATFVWVMNKNWYAKLNADQKKVIDSHCTNEWASRIGKAWGDDEDSGKEILRKAGHTIIEMKPEQLAEWKKAAEPMVDRWLKDVSAKGHDGKALLEDFRAELKKRNALQ
jgi:TRAP-type C4-dicarboxylate transport system substrate-binding protein